MGSLGTDLGDTGPDSRSADTVLSRLGVLLWMIGVYIAFFSSTLLLTLTYVLLVALLAGPLGRHYYTSPVRGHSRRGRTAPTAGRSPGRAVGTLGAAVGTLGAAVGTLGAAVGSPGRAVGSLGAAVRGQADPGTTSPLGRNRRPRRRSTARPRRRLETLLHGGRSLWTDIVRWLPGRPGVGSTRQHSPLGSRPSWGDRILRTIDRRLFRY